MSYLEIILSKLPRREFSLLFRRISGRFTLALIVLLAACGPLAVIYGVWAPVQHAFAVHEPEISDEIVTASRSYPDAVAVAVNRPLELIFVH
jgi:hypothetical protein